MKINPRQDTLLEIRLQLAIEAPTKSSWQAVRCVFHESRETKE